MGSVGLGIVQPTQLTGLPSQCHLPFGRRHKPTLGKSRIWLGSLRRWDLGLMPFGWPVGNTKQYPLKPPSSDCAGGGVRTRDLAVFRSRDSSPLGGWYHYAILPPTSTEFVRGV